MTRATATRYAWHFAPPTPAEFRTLILSWGLNLEEAAKVTDTTRRTMSRFANDEECQCPWPVLYLLANECAGVRLEKGAWRESLNKHLAEIEQVKDKGFHEAWIDRLRSDPEKLEAYRACIRAKMNGVRAQNEIAQVMNIGKALKEKYESDSDA